MEHVGENLCSDGYLTKFADAVSLHNSFILETLYSAPSRDYYSEMLPAQSWPKKNDFREM